MDYLEEIIIGDRAYHTQREKSELSCEGCVFHKLMPQAQLYGCVAPKELFGCKLKRIIYK